MVSWYCGKGGGYSALTVGEVSKREPDVALHRHQVAYGLAHRLGYILIQPQRQVGGFPEVCDVVRWSPFATGGPPGALAAEPLHSASCSPPPCRPTSSPPGGGVAGLGGDSILTLPHRGGGCEVQGHCVFDGGQSPQPSSSLCRMEERGPLCRHPW